MEISQEGYRICFIENDNKVICQGSLMLAGTEEYAPILELLKQAAEQVESHLQLNISELDFINSSGINTMTKFVIMVRNQKSLHLSITYSEEQSWQTKLVSNLQRLMPSLELQQKTA